MDINDGWDDQVSVQVPGMENSLVNGLVEVSAAWSMDWLRYQQHGQWTG